jgi:hypothetical protein
MKNLSSILVALMGLLLLFSSCTITPPTNELFAKNAKFYYLSGTNYRGEITWVSNIFWSTPEAIHVRKEKMIRWLREQKGVELEVTRIQEFGNVNLEVIEKFRQSRTTAAGVVNYVSL